MISLLLEKQAEYNNVNGWNQHWEWKNKTSKEDNGRKVNSNQEKILLSINWTYFKALRYMQYFPDESMKEQLIVLFVTQFIIILLNGVIT